MHVPPQRHYLSEISPQRKTNTIWAVLYENIYIIFIIYILWEYIIKIWLYICIYTYTHIHIYFLIFHRYRVQIGGCQSHGTRGCGRNGWTIFCSFSLNFKKAWRQSTCIKTLEEGCNQPDGTSERESGEKPDVTPLPFTKCSFSPVVKSEGSGAHWCTSYRPDSQDIKQGGETVEV